MIRNNLTGDVIKHGADPTGTSDSSQAFKDALECNNTIYSSIPGIFRVGEIDLSRRVDQEKFLTINLEGSELRNQPNKSIFLSGANGSQSASISAKRIRIQNGKIFQIDSALSHLKFKVDVIALIGQGDSLFNQEAIGQIGNCQFNINYIECKADRTVSPIKFYQATGRFFENTFNIGFFQQSGNRAPAPVEYMPMIDIQSDGVFYGNKYSVRTWEKTYRGAINLVGDANGEITSGNFHDQTVYDPIEHDSIRATTRCRRTKISNQQRTIRTNSDGTSLLFDNAYDINVEGSHLVILDNCGPTLPNPSDTDEWFKIKRQLGASNLGDTSIRDCEGSLIEPA